MSHNPNPFDFVPFAKKDPELKTPQEWLALGNLKTGRITVQMKALTPVHIVGEQPMEKINGKDGKNIEKSLFYQRNDKYYIPGSSIRGVLRGFIEAACNGWASQLTPYFEEEKEKHTYGFKVVESETPSTAKIYASLSDNPAVDNDFCVPASPDKGIDLASFLFGYIPGKTDNKDQFIPAWKGRIMIDDVEVDESKLSALSNNKSYVVPDLNEQDAFMGGPHPRASSWWYFHPHAIEKEEVSAGSNRTVTTYHFIGAGYRGRKYYFHQDPKKSIQEYKSVLKWGLLNFFPIQCLEKGKSITFNILFSNITEQLLHLLLFTLEPGRRIRHKIGYGKAYGYGSVEFSIKEVVFQRKGFDENTDIVDPNGLRSEFCKEITTIDREEKNGIACFLHKPSLDNLSAILWYEEPLAQTFSYPYPGYGGFYVNIPEEERTTYNRSLRKAIANTLVKHHFDPETKGTISISHSVGKTISSELKEIKPALHFEVYQENSLLGKDIKEKRKFNY